MRTSMKDGYALRSDHQICGGAADGDICGELVDGIYQSISSMCFRAHHNNGVYDYMEVSVINKKLYITHSDN
jgi:hypothetical protein